MLEQYVASVDPLFVKQLFTLFKDNPSIPCGIEGKVLRNCNEVVDNQSRFANLFDESECCFPLSRITQNEVACAALRKLGMLNDVLPWSMLVERASTVCTLYENNSNKAMERASLVILASSAVQLSECDDRLSSIPFLPILPKPAGYILSWKGTDCKGLMCGNNLVSVNDLNVDVSGSQVIFVNDALVDDGGCGALNENAVKLLGIQHSPTFDEVVSHLKELIDLHALSTKEHSGEVVQVTDRMCRKIYRFLTALLSENGNDDFPSLFKLACIWTGHHFVTPSVVAKTWNLNGPYLYRLPSSLSYWTSLTHFLNIKNQFVISDVQLALAQMKKDFGNKSIDKDCQEVFKNLIPLLINCDVPEDKNTFLPDENYVLVPANKLSFNDAPWAPKDSKYRYVHGDISRDVAVKFGVVPMRTQFLERFSTSVDTHFLGSNFGQHEELTQRIQNILEGYPFDITVLKELLQNADDAKATKMYIVLDKRTHGTESILSEAWKELQGPALLVWNDSEFSENDLKGIQKLGLGSKRSNSETIGQYGIGFNVVYHLTDCPSFITGGETMCVFDPHCRYVPGADVTCPGRRFDDLTREDFWNTFEDIQSAYLRSRLDNCPPELQLGGSLFRFPLRHTEELVRMSDIVKRSQSRCSKPLRADDVQKYLKDWAPAMKEAMLFLNHVNELCFFVIEAKSSAMVAYNHYLARIDQSGLNSRAELHKGLSVFNTDSRKCLVVRYPLTIRTATHKKKTEVFVDEKWLIQQGVGDIDNERQTWQYSHIKPRHGIAAPIQLEQKSSETARNEISGKVFCFLPLPIDSHLAVHINGNFVLDATRRELWHSTDSTHEDDKATWNRKLFEAIASSYTNLLEHAQQYFLTQDNFKSHHDAFQGINKYYNTLFPQFSKLEGYYRSLVTQVHKNCVTQNSRVLAVVYGSDNTESAPVKIKWHPIISTDPSTQVYFWYSEDISGYERKHIKPLLEGMGMQLTAAPIRLRQYLNNAITDETIASRLQTTTPVSVYTYYQKFNHQVINSDSITSSLTFPCAINNTVFKRIEVFKRFVDYLLQPREENSPGFTGKVFPGGSPVHCPLLLTTDNVLRNFDQQNKVLRSEYASLFPSMQSLFLHSKLLKTEYGSEYFASKSDFEQLVKHILTNELPNELQTHKVQYTEKLMSRDRLISLWKCFSFDEAFKSVLNIVLTQWALIPTNSGYLYSTSSKVLPVFPLQHISGSKVHGSLKASLKPSAIETEAEKVFATLRMPFISVKIISAAVLPCPLLANRPAILKNLYLLSQDVSLALLLNKEMVTVIFDYFRTIDFKSDEKSLTYIKSLPIFETIDGKLCAIEGKIVFQWNWSVHTAGYSDWIKCHDVTFLQSSGAWISIGTDQLKINNIDGEKIYSRYIFKAFGSMSKDDRYAHLKHIKNSMIQRNVSNSQDRFYKRTDTRQRYLIAKEFVDGLKSLPCIGEDGELLRPVSDFCDHSLPIFTSFPKKYRFLPTFFTKEYYISSQWEQFFINLGLRQVLTKEDFLSLCHFTANSHKDPESASKVLLNHYFSTDIALKGWTMDYYFNQQVSNIAFVPAEQLPELNWIKSPFRFSEFGRVLYKDGKLVQLTKLNGTGILEYKDCLWTIMPIVSLPITHISENEERILSQLCITFKPTVQQVVSNLRNISSMEKFTKFTLFDNYSESIKPPVLCGIHSATTMMTIVQSHLLFIQSQPSSSLTAEIEQLKSTACIPVPSTAHKEDAQSWQIVLVKPCCVLSEDASSVEGFHPFLHSVPEELYQVLGFLMKIGVSSTLGVQHCQLVLETVFKQLEGQELDENTKKCVVKALQRIYFLNSISKSPLEMVAPLYLPSSRNILVLSTNLLYADSSNFYGQVSEAKIKQTKYSLIMLHKDVYNFKEKEFCDALPTVVRPLGLSKICDQTILPKYKDPVEPNEVHKKIEQTLSMKMALPRAISAAVRSEVNHVRSEVTDVFSIFVSSIHIVTVKQVRTEITFRDTGSSLGELNLSFHFQKEQNECAEQLVLYIDSKVDPILGVENIIRTLSKLLVASIKENDPSVNEISLSKLSEKFNSFLKMQTPDQLFGLLDYEAIPYITKNDDDPMKTPVIEIGKEIPAEWHHRLDQTINNVFHPGEIVGYENMENCIIYARIMHPIFPKDGNLDSVPRIDMKYRILIDSSKEEEMEDAGILELYKFLRGPKPSQSVNEDEKDLVLLEGETKLIKLRRIFQEKDLEEVKSELAKQLDDIWNLAEENRRKAIKRMYLKWHPDKNPDNQDFAENVFKFLNSEIEKRESGRIDLSGLNDMAKRHRENFYREKRQYYASAHHQHPSSSSNTEGKPSSPDSPDSQDKFGSSGWGAPSEDSDHSDPFSDNTVQPQPNANEGRRWLKQAVANFITLEIVFNKAKDSPVVSGDVCFMAHQVAEKALKGGKYFVCGLDAGSLVSHNISTHAYGLQSERPGETHGLVNHTTPLENYYLEPRYPNRWAPDVVPANMYSYEQAKQAKDHAEAILKIIQNIADYEQDN